jgi:WD40 repeat protein
VSRYHTWKEVKVPVLVYGEWLLCPVAWVAVLVFAFLVTGAGFGRAGRLLRTLAAVAFVAEVLLLVADSVLGNRIESWRALAGRRLLLELLAAGVAGGILWARHRGTDPSGMLARGPVTREPLAKGFIGVVGVAILGLAPWLVPAPLRSGLSLAREVGAGPGDPRSLRALYVMSLGPIAPGALLTPALPLVERAGSGAAAVACVLRYEVGPDGRPSLEGTRALMDVLGSTRSAFGINELRRWSDRPDAAPALRTAAVIALQQAGDRYATRKAAEMLATTVDGAGSHSQEGALASVCAKAGSSDCDPAVRAMLRRPGNGEVAADELIRLLRSDSIEDRAAVTDFFLDSSRFNAARDVYMRSADSFARFNKALQPLLSDLLEDDDAEAQKRACEYLVGKEWEARRRWADLWNEVQGYPCSRLEDPDRATVASAIRRAFGLPPARPSLPATARLPPRVAPEILETHAGWVYAIAISPDGSRAATMGDIGIELWDVATSRRTRAIRTEPSELVLGFSAGTSSLLTYGPWVGARAYRIERGTLLRSFARCTAPGAPSFSGATQGPGALSENGAIVATGGDGVCLWDVADGDLLRRIEPCGKVEDPVQAPIGRPGRPDRPGMPGPEPRSHALALSRDGGTLVAACARDVRWFDTETGAWLGAFPIGDGMLVGRLAALGSRRALRIVSVELAVGDPRVPATVRLWTAASRRLLWSSSIGMSGQNRALEEDMRARHSRGTRLAVSPDERKLLLAGSDLCLWNLESGEKVRCLASPSGAPVTAIAWSPVGDFVMGADEPASSSIVAANTGPPQAPRGIHVWRAGDLEMP